MFAAPQGVQQGPRDSHVFQGVPGTAAQALRATWGMISSATDAAAAEGVCGDAGLLAACSGCRLVQASK